MADSYHASVHTMLSKSREDGEDISAKTARDIISHLIGEEDKRNPLSDQKIADILGDRGLKIARRTVAKYREQLDIPTARYRKRYDRDSR